MDEYVNAKKNIFLHQNAFGRTVLNADNALTAACAPETRGETLFSPAERRRTARGAAKAARFFRRYARAARESDILIPGKHNVENYLAAISAVWGECRQRRSSRLRGLSAARAPHGASVRTLDGVRW